MVKIASEKIGDSSSVKLMRILLYFLPLIKNEEEESYSFHWLSWKTLLQVILFLGAILSTPVQSWLSTTYANVEMTSTLIGKHNDEKQIT